MDKINLPPGIASEPNEEAHQPMNGNSNMDCSDRECLRSSAVESEMSHPTNSMSHLEKLLWLQKRRQPGLWAQCDKCSSWRYLAHVIDRHELPKKWYCNLNPDKAKADCSVPEDPIRIRDEEDLIHSEYSAGSLVWARVRGWSWWPAMVDDCPCVEQFYWLDGFSDIPTDYNVVFFDLDVTRAWISVDDLKPYLPNKNIFKQLLKDKRYKIRMEVARSQAEDAAKLPLQDRLAKYSFISRFKGSIRSPSDYCNRKVVDKYQKRLQKRFNIAFSNGDSEDEEELDLPKPNKVRQENAGDPGTPKSSKTGFDLKKRKLVMKEDRQEDCNDLIALTNTAVSTENMCQDNVQKFVQHDSMTARIYNTATINGSSSATCAPDTETGVNDLCEDEIRKPNIQVCITSPNSDDFDF